MRIENSVRRISRRAILLPVIAFTIALGGCSGETQQQKFVAAMNHGNSAQASQIWLHMDAKNRLEFDQNQGTQPNVSSDEVKKQVMQHYADKMAGENNNENDGETVDNPAPSVHLGGLQSLPEWSEPSGAPPEKATVPTMNEPSN